MKKIGNWMGKAVLALSAFVVMFSACDNKEPLPEGDGNGDVVVDSVADSLENVITRQVRAMRTILLENEIGVSSCAVQENGSYMVTLSTGLTFVSLADDQEYSSILTYDEVDSEKVWAMIEKDGDVDPILNANGNNHALSNEIEVEIENEKYRLLLPAESKYGHK